MRAVDVWDPRFRRLSQPNLGRQAAPGLPLFNVIVLSQVVNGLLLPFILVFVMLLARDRQLMWPLRSGRVLTVIGWCVTFLLAAMSVVLIAVTLAPSPTQGRAPGSGGRVPPIRLSAGLRR